MRDFHLQVMGLGSPLRGDDGAGPCVVRLLAETGPPEGVHLTEAGTCGFSVGDLLAPCRRLVLVDAIQTGAAAGTIHELDLADLASFGTSHSGSSHGLDLAGSLALQERLRPEGFPESIRIYAVEALSMDSFCDQLSEPVQKACEELARRIALCFPGLSPNHS